MRRALTDGYTSGGGMGLGLGGSKRLIARVRYHIGTRGRYESLYGEVEIEHAGIDSFVDRREQQDRGSPAVGAEYGGRHGIGRDRL